MLIPSIRLLAYASPATAALDEARQADTLARALLACQRNFIELDFSGLDGASLEFTELFFRHAEAELADVWLAPRNYDFSCARLVRPLLSRLQQQREQAWAAGCETSMATGRRQAAD